MADDVARIAGVLRGEVLHLELIRKARTGDRSADSCRCIHWWPTTTGWCVMSDKKSIAQGPVGLLRVALLVVGLIFVVGVYPLTEVWPSGWSWGHGSSHYLAMIIGLYATLGVFLLLATRDPLANRSLIWFTVVSSVVHAAIMAVQAISDSNERGHLLGDVPALLIVAALLAVLMRRAETPRTVGVGSG